MRKLALALARAGLLFFVGMAYAGGDPHAGKARAGVCVACHGPAGISTNPEWPNIAGQKAAYLAKQLRAFRDGVRQDPLMSPIAQGLSDADIDNLAAYFSALKP